LVFRTGYYLNLTTIKCYGYLLGLVPAPLFLLLPLISYLLQTKYLPEIILTDVYSAQELLTTREIMDHTKCMICHVSNIIRLG
jgi:hypothetical protein